MPNNKFKLTDAIPFVGPAISTGLGLILQKHNDRRQIEQQKKLTEIQKKAQQELSAYNLSLQKNLWDYTNYENQVQHLKSAGLNPALLYGKGGPGGATAAAATGNATGATASGNTGEALAATQLGIQLAMQQAQIKNIQANTEKTNAEAKKISGIDTQLAEAQKNVAEKKLDTMSAEIQSKAAQMALTNVQTEIARLDKFVKQATQWDVIDQIDMATQKVQQELFIIQNDKQISDNTKHEIIKQSKIATYTAILNNQLTNAKINLTNKQINKLANEIYLNWYKYNQDERYHLIHSELEKANTKFTNKKTEYFFFNGIMNGIGQAAKNLKSLKK